MMRKGKIMMILFFAFCLGLLLLTDASAFHCRYSRGVSWHSTCIPGLTQEQAQKIQALEKRHIEEVAPLRQNLLQKRLELMAALRASEVDEGKVFSLQKEISKIASDLQERRLRFRLEIQKMLTPEQRVRLHQFQLGCGHRMRGF